MEVNENANEIRKSIVSLIVKAKGGHIGSSLCYLLFVIYLCSLLFLPLPPDSASDRK